MISKLKINQIFDFSNWLVDDGYYVDVMGRTVTQEQMCDPGFVPHVRIVVCGFDLVVNLVDGRIYTTGRGFRVWVRSRRFRPILRRLRTFRFRIGGLDSNGFLKFAFPIIRRSFPSLISSNLVSVQPMSQPLSSIIYQNMLKYMSKTI